jgi:hypothetical protein
VPFAFSNFYKNNRCYFIVPQNISIVSLLILFVAFRAYIQTDWVNYYRFYKDVPSLFEGKEIIRDFLGTAYYENGYVFYAVLCKTISSEYLFFQAVSSIIDITVLYVFFKTYIPKYIVLAFATFFIFKGLLLGIAAMRNIKAILLFLI